MKAKGFLAVLGAEIFNPIEQKQSNPAIPSKAEGEKKMPLLKSTYEHERKYPSDFSRRGSSAIEPD